MNKRPSIRMMGIHDCLPPNGTDLNFDVDDTERLCANVDLNQPRVHGFVEVSEARHETDGPFNDSD